MYRSSLPRTLSGGATATPRVSLALRKLVGLGSPPTPLSRSFVYQRSNNSSLDTRKYYYSTNINTTSSLRRLRPRTTQLALSKQLTRQNHIDTMDAAELANYLADSPPTVVPLEIKKHFEALTVRQKRYAHYISKFVFLPLPLLPALTTATRLTSLTPQGLLRRHTHHPPPSLPRKRIHL